MDSSKLDSLLEDLASVHKLPRLSAAADDVDKIIELLSTAREHVAESEHSNVPPPLAIHTD
jgi:hypothetical protein